MRHIRSGILIAAAALAAACTDGTGPGPVLDVPLALSLETPAGVSTTESDALGRAFDQVTRFQVTVTDAVDQTLFVDTLIRVTPGLEGHSLGVQLPEAAIGVELLLEVAAFAGEVQMFVSTLGARVIEMGATDTTQVPVRYVGPGVRGSVANAAGGVAGVPVALVRAGTQIATTTTGADGSFLFTELDAGTYVVRPAAPAGARLCPAERTITLASQGAQVAGFQLRNPCTVRVLVVSGGDIDDTGAAAAVLAGIPEATIDRFFLVGTPPSIETLRRYDVVLLFQNGLSDESVALGNELARFVELGGNVVFGSFYWQGRSDSGLGGAGWGGLEAIDPFASAGAGTYTSATLGTVVAHELTEGLRSLSSSGFRGGVTARVGTQVVARWSDGVPLVGFRLGSAGQRLVGVSLFPAHAAVGGVSGDFARLWQNAVSWAGAAGGPARTGPVAAP